MAPVYQCVRCKAIFKDLSSVRTHACRSVTNLKDSQNPRKTLVMLLAGQMPKDKLLAINQINLEQQVNKLT